MILLKICLKIWLFWFQDCKKFCQILWATHIRSKFAEIYTFENIISFYEIEYQFDIVLDQKRNPGVHLGRTILDDSKHWPLVPFECFRYLTVSLSLYYKMHMGFVKLVHGQNSKTITGPFWPLLATLGSRGPLWITCWNVISG